MFSTSTNNNINLGTADCIESSSQFTQSVYYNICTGTKTEVPIGFYDYMLSIPIAILFTVVAIFSIVFLIKFIRD